MKNIFAKPGRLIVILLCMIVACFAGFLALDLGNGIGDVFKDFGKAYVGEGDYLVAYFGPGGVTGELFEGTVPLEFVGRGTVKKREITRSEELYNYAITETINLYTFSDPEKARSLECLQMENEPGEGEVAISQKYSEKYGYEIGDELTVYDYEDNPVSLTVVNIYDNESFLGDMSGYINADECSRILGKDTYTIGVLGVDDNDRDEFERFMAENHPNVVVTPAYMPEAYRELFRNITYILYLVFVLVFVLVIFVTISFVEKIVVERMSVIGTLRSIGMSMRKTTFILIAENIIYGIAGSIIAFLIYLVSRRFILTWLGNMSGVKSDIGHANFVKCGLVMLGALLIQIIVPLKEILKAVKTSIRDIIFDSRDGEYRVSFAKTILGFMFIIGGFCLAFTIKNLPVSIVSILLMILGGGLSIQFIVKKITLALSKYFGKLKMPVAELASFETGSKKPNSSNAVLAVAAITASAAIFVIGSSIVETVKRPAYDADIVVQEGMLRTAKYEYLNELDGVNEVEYIYEVFDAVSINGKSNDFSVMALPKTDRYLEFGHLPSEIGENEVIIDIQKAAILDIKPGDTLEVVFHNNGIFPRTRTLTVVAVTQYNRFLGAGTIILNEKLYNELYTDEVSCIIISADDPDKVKVDIENSLIGGEIVKTRAEYIADLNKDGGTVTLILAGVMAAAIGLTLIGISGNQIIGFASRKKEYAMLHSCACPKRDIIRMILTENGLLFGISVIVSACLCVPVTLLVERIFVLSDTGIIIVPRYEIMFISLLSLWGVTMITAMSPVKSIKKMNTAMEMKYE